MSLWKLIMLLASLCVPSSLVGSMVMARLYATRPMPAPSMFVLVFWISLTILMVTLCAYVIYPTLKLAAQTTIECNAAHRTLCELQENYSYSKALAEAKEEMANG